MLTLQTLGKNFRKKKCREEKKSFSYISTVVRKHHQLQEPILTPRQKQKTSTLSIKLHIFQSTNKRQPVLFKEEKFSVDLHYIKIYNEENNYRHRFIQRLSNFSRSRKSCRKRYQKHKSFLPHFSYSHR